MPRQMQCLLLPRCAIDLQGAHPACACWPNRPGTATGAPWVHQGAPPAARATCAVQVKMPGSSEYEPSRLLTRSTYTLDQVGLTYKRQREQSWEAAAGKQGRRHDRGGRPSAPRSRCPPHHQPPVSGPSLAQMSGTLTVKGDGTVALVETDGIDFAPTTVKVGAGRRAMRRPHSTPSGCTFFPTFRPPCAIHRLLAAPTCPSCSLSRT